MVVHALAAGVIVGALDIAVERAMKDVRLSGTAGSEIVVDVGGKQVEFAVRESAPASAFGNQLLQEIVVKAIDGLVARMPEVLEPQAPASLGESKTTK